MPLVVSAGATVATAVALDILAAERPLHTVTLALVAVIVGLGRLRCAGRLRGMFAAVSLAVLAQPAVHAATKLVHLTPATPGHPAEVWSADVTSIVVHVGFALLAVTISTSEPVLEGAARSCARGLRQLAALLFQPAPPAKAERPRPATRGRSPKNRRDGTFTTRRGPPQPGPAC